MFTMHYNYVVC